MKLLGRGDASYDREQTFVSLAAGLSPKLIQPQPNSSAIKPGFHLRRVSPPSAPEPYKRLNGEFLRASRIANDSSDDSRNAVEPSAEELLDVEGHIRRGCRFEDNFAGCVHTHITTEAKDL